MATIAQGQLAGTLANNLISLQGFIAAMQKAVTAGASVESITLITSTGIVSFDATISVPDTAILLNNLITLYGQLNAEWTNMLAAL
jgi:hypothetical protein